MMYLYTVTFRRMAETLLTIQEVASITGKSIQTVRRAIKARKIISKRKKTPQGFNYLITQDSIISFYKLDKSIFQDRERGSLDRKRSFPNSETTGNFATLHDLKNLQNGMEELLNEYKKEKESFVRFIKAFQDRFVVMENQMKLLEEPDKKRWYQFWK